MRGWEGGRVGGGGGGSEGGWARRGRRDSLDAGRLRLAGQVLHDHRRVGGDGGEHGEPGVTRHGPGGGFPPLRHLGLGDEAGAFQTNAGGELGDVSTDQVRQARAQSRSGAWKRENFSVNRESLYIVLLY